VTNETSNDVFFVKTSTSTAAPPLPVPKNPRGARFSADGSRLWVASEKDHVVSVIDVAARRILRTVPTGGQRPVDVILSGDGRHAWVSHGQSGDVRVLDAATMEVLATIAVGPRAWWMALDDAGALWVAVGRANEVVGIDTGRRAVVARVPPGTLPWGVTVAPRR